MSGVRGIDDQLAVALGPRPSDHNLAAEIRERLRSDVRVADDALDVSVHDGDVAISGTVSSAAERTRAWNDARVNGVHSVDVDVASWETNAMRAPAGALTNEEPGQVAKVVKRVLSYDPRLLGFEPEIRVKDRTVEPIGNAPTLSAKRAAIEDTMNTKGVGRVEVLEGPVFLDPEVVGSVDSRPPAGW